MKSIVLICLVCWQTVYAFKIDLNEFVDWVEDRITPPSPKFVGPCGSGYATEINNLNKQLVSLKKSLTTYQNYFATVGKDYEAKQLLFTSYKDNVTDLKQSLVFTNFFKELATLIQINLENIEFNSSKVVIVSDEIRQQLGVMKAQLSTFVSKEDEELKNLQEEIQIFNSDYDFVMENEGKLSEENFDNLFATLDSLLFEIEKLETSSKDKLQILEQKISPLSSWLNARKSTYDSNKSKLSSTVSDISSKTALKAKLESDLKKACKR